MRGDGLEAGSSRVCSDDLLALQQGDTGDRGRQFDTEIGMVAVVGEERQEFRRFGNSVVRYELDSGEPVHLIVLEVGNVALQELFHNCIRVLQLAVAL